MMMGGHSAMSDSVPRWFCYAHPKLIPQVVAYLLHYDRTYTNDVGNCTCILLVIVVVVVAVVQQIKLTANQVEKLAPQVTSAALSAHSHPSDQAQQHLTLVKDEWTAKVKQLTAAIDDVMDAQELLTASGLLITLSHSYLTYWLLNCSCFILWFGNFSEALIREDMTRCRDSIQHSDGHGVLAAVTAVERRCHRLLELAKNELKNTEDPMQSYALTTTIAKMENGIK